MLAQIKKLFDSSNVVFIIFLVMAVSLIYNTLGVIQKNYTLQQQVDELEQEVALIELENQNLGFNIEYYKTDAFLEVEAKRRFNLAEKGETVVLLEKDGDAPAEETEEIFTEESSRQQDNFDAWMTFLFGSNS